MTRHTHLTSRVSLRLAKRPSAGTDNPKRQELEGTDGGNVGTDIISPQEGASDDKSDEPPVLPSNPPPNGKIFMYQKYLE